MSGVGLYADHNPPYDSHYAIVERFVQVVAALLPLACGFTGTQENEVSMAARPRVLVTGGGTRLGDAIASALLAEGAEVVLFVRPGAEPRLGPLANRVRWLTADVWDSASLKGRARGCSAAVHTVGGLDIDLKRGITHQWLNFVSARNIANLCASSGVGHMVLISSARAPWMPASYIAAKREAEMYLSRVGLRSTIIRSPLVYQRGEARPPFFSLLTALRPVPPFRWMGLQRAAPIALDVLARGVARLTLEARQGNLVCYADDLRRRSTRGELRRGFPTEREIDATRTGPPPPIPIGEDEGPFGWTPYDPL